MIAKITTGLKKRKAKLFFVFLLCSFFAWFVSNLSETYASTTTFDLKFVGVPENKMLISASKQDLDVKLQAVGFQFLRFNFNHDAVTIDLSEVAESEGRYFVTKNEYLKQIEEQLSSSMQLVQILDDTLFFELKEVVTKELPVAPVLDISFEQNYLLDGAVTIEPAIIRVIGPISEVDSIVRLKTKKIELDDLSSDFSQTVFIVKPDSLKHSSFSGDQVTVSGKVSKFSEKVVKVKVEVLNLPKNMGISTFPEEIEVLCKAKLSDLKNISGADFRVTADYKELLQGSKGDKLSVAIQKKPNVVFGAILVQKEVSYLLKKK